MKKIINGVRYDSDKAKAIGSASRQHGSMSSWSATLYVTPQSRRFFLIGEGGAMSRFRKPSGSNGFCYGGPDLQPITEAEALTWAESFLSTEVVEQHFADRIQDA
jgi:hypothetical protein